MLEGELISGGMVVLLCSREMFISRDIVTAGNIFPMMTISREYKFLLNRFIFQKS